MQEKKGKVLRWFLYTKYEREARWRSDMPSWERWGAGSGRRVVFRRFTVSRVAKFYRVCLVAAHIRMYQKYFMHISCAFMNSKLSFLANKLDVLPPHHSPHALRTHYASAHAPAAFNVLVVSVLCSVWLLLLFLFLLILSQASKSSCKWQEFVAFAHPHPTGCHSSSASSHFPPSLTSCCCVVSACVRGM